jgi:hypothetical protein
LAGKRGTPVPRFAGLRHPGADRNKK